MRAPDHTDTLVRHTRDATCCFTALEMDPALEKIWERVHKVLLPLTPSQGYERVAAGGNEAPEGWLLLHCAIWQHIISSVGEWILRRIARLVRPRGISHPWTPSSVYEHPYRTIAGGLNIFQR